MEKITLKLLGSDNYFVQEATKTLRTNVQFCGQNVKVITVTSCQASEGKSTVTLHLAASLAELNKRVLVIDADMRKSVMAGRNTSARRPAGLSEVLSGMAKLKDCLYEVDGTTLHILFAGQYPPNPVELLSSEYFDTLLEEARKVYDYILIDSPPLGPVIDAAVIAPKSDGVVLVMDAGQVRCSQAREVVEQLRKSKSKILGTVLNNVRKSGSGYYKYKYKSDRYYGKKNA